MIPKILTNAELEDTYDAISEGIDRAGADNTVVFLAKLSLALANMLGDPAKIGTAIDASLKDL